MTVNPVPSYDPKRIVRHSLEEDRRRYGSFRAFIKKWFVYPLTLNFGLKFVARRLRRGEWHAYTGEGLIAELRAASWTVVHTETVYGGCACLAVAHGFPPESGEPGKDEA